MVPYFQLPSFHMGPVNLEPFGVLVCIGIVIGVILAQRRARAIGLDPKVIRDLARLCVVFGLFGAHLVHLIAYHPEELYLSPWVIFLVWQGMSSFGGFAGAGIAVAIYLKRNKIRFLPYADALLYGFFPGWIFGRTGCSVAHDHPGRPSDFFLAMKYPDGPRHDLGFYELLLTVFFWVPLLYWLGRKKSTTSPQPGATLAIMGIAYSLPRFFLDFLRATDIHYHDARYLGLTPAQYACVACIVLGIRFFLKQHRAEPGSITPTT